MNHEENRENTVPEAENENLPVEDGHEKLNDEGNISEPEGEHYPVDPVAPADSETDIAAALAEEKDKYVRLYSEFDNFRKRTGKEKLEMMQTAGKDIILSMLSVIDDFERALKILSTADDAVKTNLEGFELIYKKMLTSLEAKGVKAMETVGKPFDVEFQEAITRFPAPNEDMKGKVIDEVEKGYTLNGHVIRFAKVVIGE